MKLHLPTRLRAAVLACVTAVAALASTVGTGVVTSGVVAYTIAASQAEAREATPATTVAGDTTYNGYVYTMLLDNNTGDFHARNFALATYESGAWVDGATYAGNGTAETPLGAGVFWTQFCATPVPKIANSIDYYGNTLRLGPTSAQAKVTPAFTDFCLGGLVVEKGSMSSSADTTAGSAYWFWRGGSMQFNGTGDVNMDIADHVRFSYADEVAIKKGGVWNIASTGSISFDNNSSLTATTLKLEASQHVTIQGGGKVNVGRSGNGTYNMSLAAGSVLEVNGSTMAVAQGTTTIEAGAALTIGAGSVVTHSSIMNAAGAINNGGTLTLAATNLTGSLANTAAGSALTLTGALTLDVSSLTTDSAGMLDVSKGSFDYSGGSLALTGDATLGEGVYTIAQAADATAAAAIASALSSSSMHSVSNDGNIVKMTVNAMATLDEDLVAPPNFRKSYVSGLNVGEHIVNVNYTSQGFSSLYTRGLKGSGNITFNRTFTYDSDDNLCVLWIDGDASGYTGTVSFSGPHANAFLKLGSDAVASTNLSAATVNMDKQVIALGGNVSIGSLNTDGTVIRAVDGLTSRISEMEKGGMKSSYSGFAQDDNVSRNLLISTMGDVRNTTISKGVNLEVAAGAHTELQDCDVQGSLTNNGQLTLLGAITLSNAITMSEGANTIFASDMVLDLSGLTREEGGVYRVTNGLGTTDFGSLTMSNITGIDITGYTARFDNDGTITLVDAANDLVWNGGNSTWDDSTENWLNGSEAAHFSTYDNVRFATEGAVVTVAGDKATHGVMIDADTTWTGTATVNTPTIGGDGTLTLDSGISLAVTSSAEGAKLSGSGTYILSAASSSMMGAVLADGWTGTVALNRDSNTVLSVSDLNLNNYAAGENGASTVELTSIRGHFLKSTLTFKPNLVLKNSPAGNLAALELNNGYGVSVYTFAGDISGSGNWVVNMSGTGPAQNYIFEGDLSGWTGNFCRQSAKDVSLTFNGKAGNTGLSVMELGGDGGTTTISGTADVSVGSLILKGSNLTLNTNLTSRGELKVAELGASAGKTLTIAEGKSLNAPSLLNSWGANLSLRAGAALNITGVAAISSGPTQRTWAGAGVGSSFVRVGGLSNSNYANTVFRALTLEIGASGISLTATGERFVFDGITVAAAADWTATSANATSGLLELVNEVTFATGAHNVTIGSTVTGEGSLVKTGDGTLTVSSESTYAGGTTVNGGTLDVVGAIGAGDITVGSGASIILHNKIDATKLINNGTLEIASGFSGLESAGVIGIEGGAEGNGFNQGGETNIFKTTGTVEGTLSAVFNGATVAITADGTLTLTDDWGTYHINNALLETETFNAIKTAAAAHSANLVGIDFAAENQSLKVDADGFATSMVQGEQAASATLAVGSGLTVTVDSTTIPAITAADDAEITLNMAESASLGNMTGASTLHVTGTNASNTLNLGNSAMARELTIANATVTTSYSGANSGTGFNTGTTFIGAGGTLSLTAGSDALGWNANSAGTITLLGEEGNLAAFELGGRATLKTNIVMQGNSIIKPTASPAGTGENVPALDPYGATLTVSGKNNVIAVNIRQRSAMTITVAEASDLTVTGSLTRYGTDGTFTKDGTGTITFASPTADTFSGYKHKAGSSVFSGMKGLIFDKEVDASGSGASTGSVSFVNGTEASINSTLWLGGNVSILVDETSTLTKHTGACDVSISGAAGQTAAIAASDANVFVDISAETVTISNAAATVTAANAVDVALSFAATSSVTNAGVGALTLTNTGVTSLAGVNAQGGDITLNAATSIGSVTIAAGKTLTAAAEGPLSITSSLTAGAGSTLASALTIGNGAALDLVTGDNALSLGSNALTLGTGLTLTEAMKNAIEALEAEASLTLMKNVTSLTGGSISATDVFTGLTGDYTLMVQDGNLVVNAAALPSAELTWLGGDGTWGGTGTPWTSDGDPSAYVEGAVVTIGGEGGATGGVITVQGAQTAKSVTIAESGYTITRGGNSDTLTISGNLVVNENVNTAIGFMPTLGESSQIVVNDGATLNIDINNPGADVLGVVLNKGTGAGTIAVKNGGMIMNPAEGYTLNTNLSVDGGLWLNGPANATRTLTVTEGNTMTLTGKLSLNSGAEVVVDGGKLNAGEISLGHSEVAKYKGTLHLVSGEVTTDFITITRTDTADVLTVDAGTLTIAGNTDGNAFVVGANDKAVVTIGAATLTNGDKDLAFNHGSTLTDTTVTAQEGTTITVGGTGMTTNVATGLTTNGTVNMAGTTAVTGAATVTDNGTLTIDSLAGAEGSNVTLAGTGTTTITGGTADTLTAGKDATVGNLTVKTLAGTGTLTQTTGTTLTMADGGTLSGSVTTGDITAAGSLAKTGTDTVTTGDITGASTALTVSGGTLSAGAVTVASAEVATGATLTSSGKLTTTGALTLSGAATADSADIASLALNAGGSLTCTNDLKLGGLTLNSAITSAGVTAASLSSESLDITASAELLGALAMGAGDSLTIVGLTSQFANGLTLNGSTDATLDAFGYKYTVESTADGIVILKTDAGVVWTGGADDEWGKEGSWQGGSIPTGDDISASFTGKGDGTVKVSTDGVTIGQVIVTSHDAAEGAKSEYTFTNGELTIADDMKVLDGHVIIGTTVAATDVTIIPSSDTAVSSVTVNGDGSLSVSGTLAVESETDTTTGSLAIQEGGFAGIHTLASSTADVALGGTLAVEEGVIKKLTEDNGTKGNLVVGSMVAPMSLTPVVPNEVIILEDSEIDTLLVTGTGDLTTKGDLTADTSTEVAGTVKAEKNLTTGDMTVTSTGDVTVGSAAAPATLDVATLENAGVVTVYNTMKAATSVDNTDTGTLDIKGELQAAEASVENSKTLTVGGALAADTLTTNSGATTEAKDGATIGTALENHGSTTITGDLVSADTTTTEPGSAAITNDATGTGEKLVVTGNVSGAGLTTETGATTEIGGAATLADGLTNHGTTTITGDASVGGGLTNTGTTTITGATNVGGAIANTGTLATGALTADSLANEGNVSVTGNAAVTSLTSSAASVTTVSGALTVGKNGTGSLNAAGKVQAASVDISGLAAGPATVGELVTDAITLNSLSTPSAGLTVGTLKSLTPGAVVQLTLSDDVVNQIAGLNANDTAQLLTVKNAASDPVDLTQSARTVVAAALDKKLLTYEITNGKLTILSDGFDKGLTLSETAAAGVSMAQEAYLAEGGAPTGDLKGVTDALKSYRSAGDSASAEKLGRALSGVSIASLGLAASNDVARQLRAIRNRTTTMGVDQCEVNEDMPYVNAWVNAEGDYRNLDADGAHPGYKMSSWGGTVGFDVDCTPRFTCGLAATAMYGDFSTGGADNAEGDVNTYYVSVFGRYAAHRWTHTGVATFGLSDISLNRTINYGDGSAKTTGDTNGTSFGAMYEIGYVMALDEDKTTCLQPIVNVSFRHIGVDGYAEKDSNVGVKADDIDMNVVTFGAGARLQSIVGENIYNRSSIFECRAMVKVDAGDTEAETKTAINALNSRSRTVKSADMGNVGFEIGAGLTVPVGQESGSIFVDASAEFRSGYSSVNGTVGYRINF